MAGREPPFGRVGALPIASGHHSECGAGCAQLRPCFEGLSPWCTLALVVWALAVDACQVLRRVTVHSTTPKASVAARTHRLERSRPDRHVLRSAPGRSDQRSPAWTSRRRRSNSETGSCCRSRPLCSEHARDVPTPTLHEPACRTRGARQRCANAAARDALRKPRRGKAGGAGRGGHYHPHQTQHGQCLTSHWHVGEGQRRGQLSEGESQNVVLPTEPASGTVIQRVSGAQPVAEIDTRHLPGGSAMQSGPCKSRSIRHVAPR